MDGGAVHGVAKSRTRLSDFTHFETKSLSQSKQWLLQNLSLICSFNKYLPSHSLKGGVFGSKQGKQKPCPHGACSLVKETDEKQLR